MCNLSQLPSFCFDLLGCFKNCQNKIFKFLPWNVFTPYFVTFFMLPGVAFSSSSMTFFSFNSGAKRFSPAIVSWYWLMYHNGQANQKSWIALSNVPVFNKKISNVPVFKKRSKQWFIRDFTKWLFQYICGSLSFSLFSYCCLDWIKVVIKF